MLLQFMQESRASIRNLETQVGQMAKQISDKNEAGPGGGTVNYPREQCQAIETRSGRMLTEYPMKK